MAIFKPENIKQDVMKNKTVKLAMLVLISLLTISCTNNSPRIDDLSPKIGIAYDENNVNLDSIKLFMEDDKTPFIKVNENVSRKYLYLNGIMTVVVEFNNGPMAEPDPFHSHVHEQTCYIAEGEVIVTIGYKQATLKAGDVFVVPSNVPHTVQSLTQKLRLIDSFNPVREDFIEK